MTGATLDMSLEAMIWALEQAPDVPPQCVGVLMGLANHADSQGRGVYAGQKLLASYARKSDRSVRNDLTQLMALGLIRKGDQSLAEHIPADCRPVVYDLPLERKQASARQSASARKQASPSTGDWLDDQHPDQDGSGGSGSTLPGGSEEQRERKPASYKPTTNQQNSSTKSSARSPRRNLNEGREDVMRLCVHLADQIEANGSLRPNISVEWQDEARLLLDKDGRTEDAVHLAIDWCQANHFWHRNIMSMPTLREKYDRIRLDAKAERDAKRAGSNGRGGHQAFTNPDPEEYEARY